MMSSGVSDSHGSSGTHSSSAATSVSSCSASVPSDMSASLRLLLSLISGSFLPSMATTMVITAIVLLPMSSSFASEPLASDLSLPATRLKVSRSTFILSLKDICEHMFSPSVMSVTVFVSTAAETQSTSLRSRASETSDTRFAMLLCDLLSHSRASLSTVPRRELGPRLSQHTATCTLAMLIPEVLPCRAFSNMLYAMAPAYATPPSTTTSVRRGA
mmetsp:Transcript_21693/g.49126  ORF Transcript_21693/g.49126 Transcript_21693/m.49126 type:complete len:216 (-) Transcript_21693:521-1168(-)